MHLQSPVRLTIKEIRFSNEGVDVEVSLQYPSNYTFSETIHFPTDHFPGVKDLLRSIAQAAYQRIESDTSELQRTFDASPAADTQIFWTDDLRPL